MRLRESSANIDATRASYYPALSLTGSLGSASSSLLRVMQNPVATLGAGITLPFLQWREMQLTNKVSQNQFEEAVVNFRQTLYQAMSDVENGLSARTQYAAQAILLKQSYEAAISAERIYEIRYRSGAVALKLLLDAQEKRRTAELAVTQNRLDQLQTHVTLYQALGGAPNDVDTYLRRSLQSAE
jgi:outer membrane protein TolC